MPNESLKRISAPGVIKKGKDQGRTPSPRPGQGSKPAKGGTAETSTASDAAMEQAAEDAAVLASAGAAPSGRLTNTQKRRRRRRQGQLAAKELMQRYNIQREEGLASFLTTTGKQLCKVSQQTSECHGILMDCLDMPSDDPILKDIRDEVANYMAVVRAHGHSEDRPPLLVGIALALIQGLARRTEVDGRRLKLLKGLAEIMTDWSVNELMLRFRFIKVGKMFRSDRSMLMLSIVPISYPIKVPTDQAQGTATHTEITMDIRELIVLALADLPNTKLKHGKAPSGAMEETISRWLIGMTQGVAALEQMEGDD